MFYSNNLRFNRESVQTFNSGHAKYIESKVHQKLDANTHQWSYSVKSCNFINNWSLFI